MKAPIKLITEQVEDLKTLAANPRQRFPTGFPSLDAALQGGPTEGEVVYFLGRSGVGKSLAATNIMWRNPDRGLIFFSLEMPAHQVVGRLFSHVTDIPGSEVVRMMANNTLPDSINFALEPYERQLVVDKSSLSIGDFTRYVDVYAEMFGEMPGCVIVDYLEEVDGGQGEGAVEAIAKGLKAFAKANRLPVFVLHQANRKYGQHEPPTEDSARFAGHTQADVMVGIWQPGKDPNLGPHVAEGMRNTIRMNIIKNRINGRQLDAIEMRMTPSMRLVDLDAKRNQDFWGV